MSDESSPSSENSVSRSENQPSGSQDQPSGGKKVTLDKLTSAFAQMLGTGQSPPSDRTDSGQAEPGHSDGRGDASREAATSDPAQAPSPRNILEAMLFVGHPENEPLTSEHAASLLRGVEPAEVDDLVLELNRHYAADGRPYYVMSDGAGYRLALRDEFSEVREQFYGRVRQARLSRAAVEILAIVAYNQPVDANEVDRLRGHPSRDALRQLVRRQLLNLEVVRDDRGRTRLYRTTPRFLTLFQLESLDDLPRHQELERR